jgi:hypothetical protein
MMAKWFGPWALSVLVLACGGRTDEGGEFSSPKGPPAPTPAEEGSEEPEKEPEGSTVLPGCEEGFDPKKEPYRTCNWLAEGRCYDEKLEACACVCPRDKASHCASGFPLENGRVEVYCY